MRLGSCLLMLVLYLVTHAACAADTAPPNILSLDFNPKAINTATSSQEITFTARLTDDQSGVDHFWIHLRSPSGNQHQYLYMDSSSRISGNGLDGTYQNKVSIPQFSEQGIWQIEFIELYDAVGNSLFPSKSELASKGFPTEFRNSPISGGFSISGMKFNDLNSNVVKDVGESGVPDWTIELLQDGNIIETTTTEADGSYSFDYLGAGTYTVSEVPQAGWTQTYPTGNVHTVSLSDKSSTGNDFGNHQLVKADVTPPKVVGFYFDPKLINTATSSQ